jgi:hypothetical protein
LTCVFMVCKLSTVQRVVGELRRRRDRSERALPWAFGARCKRALFSEEVLQLGCVPCLPRRCPPPQWSLQLRSARAPSTSPGPPSPKVGSLHSSRCLARASLCVRRACLSRVRPCATRSPGVLGGGRGGQLGRSVAASAEVRASGKMRLQPLLGSHAEVDEKAPVPSPVLVDHPPSIAAHP